MNLKNKANLVIAGINVNIVRERYYDNRRFSGTVENKPNSKPTELFRSKAKRQGLRFIRFMRR